MRIIAGSKGGRRLQAPSGPQTRPTSDRVREALFSILDTPPEGARILDLFAGSGGLGLEALSRGAKHATFVEQSNPALRVLQANINALSFGSQAKVMRGDAIRKLGQLAAQASLSSLMAFHWIFIDPPYATGLAAQCMEIFGSAKGESLLAKGGQVLVEHDRRSAPDEVYGCLVKADSRRYGDTCVAFFERSSE